MNPCRVTRPGWRDPRPLPRRRWLAGVAGLATGAALAGCATALRPPAGPRPSPPWFEVTGPEIGPCLLFGTMHVGARDDFPLPPAVEAALAAAGTLAIEIDTETRWPQLVDGFRSHVWLDGGRTLDDLIAPERVARVRQFLAIGDDEWQRLRRMQPWWVAQFRFGTAADRALGLSRDHGSERYCLRRARAAGARVVELETVDEQIDSVGGGTLDDQLAQFASLFDAVRRTGGLLAPLRDAWRRGDAAALEALKRESWGAPDAMPSVWQRAFDARDRRITDRLLAAGRDGRPLVAAIGAFHLVGPRSVPRRLQEAGCAVRPGNDAQALQSPFTTLANRPA